jgi:uncharacterized protein
MIAVKEAASQFLSRKRIAVTGVSRTPGSHGGNIIYKRLRDRGYETFAVNPNADEVEGDPCYHTLADIPGGVEAVVIATRAELADDTMRECAELGITDVWMHRSIGAGSRSPSAGEFGRAHGITVIDGGCPLMFDPASDVAHKCMRAVFGVFGRVPRTVERPAASATGEV